MAKFESGGNVSIRNIQEAALIFATAGGSANAFTLTLNPAITALTNGMIVAFRANHNITGAATLNVNGLGAKAIKKAGDQDLASGDIENTQNVVVQYDSTADVFEMVSHLANLAPTIAQIQDGTHVYAADGGGTDAYAITLSPAPASYVAGQVFRFKANTANTGAASLNVNSLGAKTIKKHNDQDVETGDIEAGQVVLVIYDGTNFQMVSQLGQAPAAGGTLVGKDLADVSQASTTEGTIYSVQVPAGTLGTTGAVHMRVFVSNFQMNSNGEYYIRCKFGATTMITLTFSSTSGTTSGYIDFYIFANAATNSQHAFAIADFQANGGANNLMHFKAQGVGTATIDSTAAVNMVITGQSQFSGSLSGQLDAVACIVSKIA